MKKYYKKLQAKIFLSEKSLLDHVKVSLRFSGKINTGIHKDFHLKCRIKRDLIITTVSSCLKDDIGLCNLSRVTEYPGNCNMICCRIRANQVLNNLAREQEKFFQLLYSE